MKTRNLFLAIAAVLCGFALASCSREESFVDEKVVEGLPIKSLSFTLTSPMEEVTPLTKASDEVETSVKDLAVVLFKKNSDGTTGDAIVLTDGTLAGPTEAHSSSTSYYYTITFDEEHLKGITSGNYYMYALANYDMTFMGYDVSSLEGMSKSDIDNLVISKGNNELGIDEAGIFMTGKYCKEDETDYDNHANHVYGDPGKYDGSVTLKGDGETDGINNLSGYIHLRRIVSKITVNIEPGTGITFTPQSLEIYNYSRSTTLMEREGFEGSKPGSLVFKGNADDFASKTGVKFTSDNTVVFYMPENVQVSSASTKSEDWTYSMRELREDTNTGVYTAENHAKFSYAPEMATYFVVKGYYSDGTYSGNVEYTVHLGDFSNGNTGVHTASGTGSYDNFTVRRNYKYNYYLTVTGVKNIISECYVESGEPTEVQPGAEGNIVQYTDGKTYNLDAHYEQVIVSFAARNIDEYSILLNTPKTNGNATDDDALYTNGGTTLASSDIGWVRFGKPASATTFNAYSPNSTVDVYSLLAELKDYASVAEDDRHFLLSSDGKTIYLAIYVSEYYYDDLLPSEFVNAGNRVMTLSMNTMHNSKDKASSFMDGVMFSLNQRAIVSVENLDSANPFGIETYDEGQSISGSVTVPTAGSSLTNGWQNFVDLLTSTVAGPNISLGSGSATGTTAWSSVINIPTNGHVTSSDNHKSGHMVSNDYGFYQCLERNRDENGNGYIDKEEIKWYLPSYDQYCILFIGENNLATDARLYPKNVSDSRSFQFFTSSNGNRRMYYSLQGITQGPFNNAANSLIAQVRCARSLKSYDGETTAIGTVSDNIITVTGLDENVMRTRTQNVEYTPAGQRKWDADDSDANSITYQFEVAKSDLDTTYALANFSDVNTGDNICYGKYSQDDDASGWRVPSLKEFYMMQKLGLLGSHDYLIRTRYWSEEEYGYYGYAISDKRIYTFFPSTTSSSIPFTTGYIRCVRDVSSTPIKTLSMYASTASITAAYTETSAKFSVLASDGVSWSIKSSNSAITVSPSSGVGSKTITVYCGAATASAKSATFTISTSTANVDNSSVTVNFTQEGLAPQENTYTWTIASGDLLATAMSSKGTPAISWTGSTAYSKDWWGTNKGACIYMGSGNTSDSQNHMSYTLTTEGIEGTVTSVIVTAAKGGTTNAPTAAVSVGGTDFGDSQEITTSLSNESFTGGELTFTGSASGTVTITFSTASGSCLDLYLKQIVIKYTVSSVTDSADSKYVSGGTGITL